LRTVVIESVCAEDKPKDKKKSAVTSLLKIVEVMDKLSSVKRIAAARCHYGVYKLICFIKQD
jgi:hypothetical protein